jgi:transmembrane sensor
MPTKLESEAYDWAIRFISGQAGAGDIKALKAWAAQSPDHAAAFDQASKVWQDCAPVGKMRHAFGPESARIAGGERAGRPSVLGRRAFLGGALAASTAGVVVMLDRPPIGLWPSWSELAADYRTATGEQRQVTLAGDVSIEMNTRTSIAIRAGERQGHIELISGEAMVSIPPSASERFVMVAANGRVIAANARFNLRRDSQVVHVTCLQGELRVDCGAASALLPEGRQIRYSGHGLGEVTAVDPAVVGAWRDGFVVFTATPISEVVGEVNRYRRTRIILTNAALGRERFSARFRIANIDRVVSQIEQVFGARARVLPGGVVLLG